MKYAHFSEKYSLRDIQELIQYHVATKKSQESKFDLSESKAHT